MVTEQRGAIIHSLHHSYLMKRKGWAHQHSGQTYCTDRAWPDKRESIGGRSFLSVGRLWHLGEEPSCLSTGSCVLIEKRWNGALDSLLMNNSSISLWIANQWFKSKIRHASLQNLSEENAPDFALLKTKLHKKHYHVSQLQTGEQQHSLASIKRELS